MAAAFVVLMWFGIDEPSIIRTQSDRAGIWLSVESTGELVLVDPGSGVAVNRVRVTSPDTRVLTIDSGAMLAVIERSSGRLVRIDPALGVASPSDTIPLGEAREVVAMPEHSWVIGSAGLARLPDDRGKPVFFDIGGPPTSHATSGRGLMVVVDHTIVEIDATGRTSVGATSPGINVTNVGDRLATITGGEVSVDGFDSMCEFGDSSDEISWVGSITGPFIVVGADAGTGVLYAALPETNRCLVFDLVDRPAAFNRPLVVDGVAYVADSHTGRLHILEVASGRVLSVDLFEPGESVELIHHRGQVIAHEPRTYHGAVVGPDGVLQLIDKSGGRPLVETLSDEIALEVGGAYASPPTEPLGGSASPAPAPESLVPASTGSPVEGAGPSSPAATEVTPIGVTFELDGPAPVAHIEISNEVVDIGEPLRFRSTSTGDVATLTWDFGDGARATVPDTVHAYSQAGVYEVTLTVANPAGSSTATVTVWVLDALQPVIVGLPTDVQVGQPVVLSVEAPGARHTVVWDFGDGTTATGTSVSHVWAAPGSYRVTARVTSETGSSSASAVVTVLPYLPPPTAAFDSPSSARVGTAVMFTDASQGAATWLWNFGDGTSATTTSASHTYPVPGTYVVTLTVTNRSGTDVATATIAVLPALPVAVFTPSTESTTIGVPVTFTNGSTGATSYLWSFGDGTTSSETSPTHTFTKPGARTVTLTVTNGAGETDSASLKIRVNNGG